MKILSWLMAIVFAGFTAVQFNDIDASIWIAAYGAVIFLSIFRATGRDPRYIALLCASMYAVWALVLLGQTNGQWWDGEMERETGGLTIGCLWCLAIFMIRPTEVSRL